MTKPLDQQAVTDALLKRANQVGNRVGKRMEGTRKLGPYAAATIENLDQFEAQVSSRDRRRIYGEVITNMTGTDAR